MSTMLSIFDGSFIYPAQAFLDAVSEFQQSGSPTMLQLYRLQTFLIVAFHQPGNCITGFNPGQPGRFNIIVPICHCRDFFRLDHVCRWLAM